MCSTMAPSSIPARPASSPPTRNACNRSPAPAPRNGRSRDPDALAHDRAPERRDLVEEKQSQPARRLHRQEIAEEAAIEGVDGRGAADDVAAAGTVIGGEDTIAARIAKRTGKE